MNGQKIIAELRQKHQHFMEFIDSLSQEEFETNVRGKWSAGQQMEHILKSVLPLARALENKAFIINKFGESNRDSVHYDVLIHQYKEKLAQGGKATSQFLPESVKWDKKKDIMSQLVEQIEKIAVAIPEYSEDELDTLQLPHPLLGLLTIREMLYFTNYHVHHHKRQTSECVKVFRTF